MAPYTTAVSQPVLFAYRTAEHIDIKPAQVPLPTTNQDDSSAIRREAIQFIDPAPTTSEQPPIDNSLMHPPQEYYSNENNANGYWGQSQQLFDRNPAHTDEILARDHARKISSNVASIASLYWSEVELMYMKYRN